MSENESDEEIIEEKENSEQEQEEEVAAGSIKLYLFVLHLYFLGSNQKCQSYQRQKRF